MTTTVSDAAQEIRFFAEALTDIERVRIAMENRLRQMTRSVEDSDGEFRGMGLSEDNSNVVAFTAMVEALQRMEATAVKTVEKKVRTGPLREYVKQATGVGEKQAARLIAAIGDPYWHVGEGRPRTVPELWAYCGYAVFNGKAQKRTKNVTSNWSNDAKMRAHLIAASCVKTKGTYRDVYDEWRAKYADAVHPHDCVRCGPKGKPALAGSPLSLGHQHARAMRKVAKRVLADMWEYSRDLHEAEQADTPLAA